MGFHGCFDRGIFFPTQQFLMTRSLAALKSTIERISASTTIGSAGKARRTFLDFRAALTRGEIRAAEKTNGHWIVNAWVKQGILLGFRLGELQQMSDGDVLSFIDKDTFPARRLTVADRVRLVPGGSSIREGAYVAPRSFACRPCSSMLDLMLTRGR